ncbi:iron permease FTR1 family protein [Virgibacillus phasianinus]|uniref:Iron permease FTR1 family protein n=1 Tax=Virgibacillus phasianinus TaxID=2017483 RepID=A0A220U4C7_9BACI|nr:FTR1 family protein [Virgibacillus phasianinus]ASK62681.1 iron permease FTR1 family protein [Virgibacillus phasianinus]
MYKRILFLMIAFLILIFAGITGPVAFAETIQDHADVSKTVLYIKKAVTAANKQDLDKVNQSFQSFKKEWVDIKNEVREGSLPVYSKIQSQIAAVSLDLVNGNANKTLGSLQALQNTLLDYQNGKLKKDGSSAEKVTIRSYIRQLNETADSIESNNLAKAAGQVKSLRANWLEIEGDIVSKSQQVYTNSERNLVLLEGYVGKGKTDQALGTVNELKTDLEPFINSSYGIWDAALIPIREGLEALLVIGALLAFTNKRKETKGARWVWGGISLGVLVSIAIGFTVSFLLNASSFGENNFIINGATGIFASIMLLYVSYWLHRHSNVQRWNSYIRKKTEKTFSSGKMFSFALIAFLAVLREGMETVIFLIGMANRMPISNLILGIVIGFGILSVIGIFMLKVGKKLPLKPFFLVSSLIVFYMCIKFMGSGIHSLQLAGYIPSTINEMIPTISFLGIYPSWSSTLPQLMIIILAVFVIAARQLKIRRAI